MSEAENTGSISSEGTNEASESENTGDDLSELEQSIANVPQPKRYKVKIDGDEQEVDEQELLSGYQSTKAAQKRMNDAARLRKQSEEFLRIASTDPRRALDALGVDIKAFARDYLAEQLEEEMLSPQEKELKTTKQRLAEYEKQQRVQEEALRATEVEKFTKHYEEEYTTGIIEALEVGGLPKTESTIAGIAKYMLQAMEADIRDKNGNPVKITPKDVVHFVKRDYLAQINSLFGSANEDILLELLGDEVSNKVVRGHLKKSKGKTIETKTKPTVPANPANREKPKALSRDEWRESIRKGLN